MSNKVLLGILISLVSLTGFYGQRHELGARIGWSSLVGDIGRTTYLAQAPVKPFEDFKVPGYLGLIYRMNFNPYQTVRIDAGYSHIQFDDRVAKEDYRSIRKLYGTNNIVEASAIFEYALFPVNNEQADGLLSPYIFAGIGGMMYDVSKVTLQHDFRRDANGVAIAPINELDFVTTPSYEDAKKFTAYVPFGFGLKYKFNYTWAISAEAMFRPTFTDELDYNTIARGDIKSTYNKDILSPTTNQSLLQTGIYYAVAQERENQFHTLRRIGNLKSKDWVNTVSLALTYSFGRPPCYCEE